MNSATVMVVDDDEALREIVCELLEESGYRVLSVANGAVALERLRGPAEKPDAILLDMMMPVMTGWQFRQEQVRDPELSSIPVVAMTSHRDLHGVAFDEVLFKPVELAELLDAVRRRTATGGRSVARGRSGAVDPSDREPFVALLESEERFRMLADNMSQQAWTCDLLGNATWHNKRWLEYTGLSLEETKGWIWSKFQHPDHLERVVATVRRSAETGEPWEETFPMRGRDGAYRWFLSRAVPIRDEAGTIVQWFGTNTDVTEQKLAEEAVAQQARELRALNERLKELGRLKSEFFSNVSHEFRTPLTLMLGPTEDLLAGELDPGVREQLELVRRNQLGLRKLVDNLLDFSRLEAGELQATSTPVDLATLTRDLASSFRSTIERAGLELRVDCETSGESVFVDEQMWEKIVLNLLSNAVKFTFVGTIAVSLCRDGTTVVLRVSDTGVGIPEADLPHVFERFYRVDGARARTREGSGIGLALVHELTTLHGGSVAVDSRLGVGTTVTVTVPVGTVQTPVGTVVGAAIPSLGAVSFVEEALRWLPEPSATAKKAEDRATSAGASARILVADDNADMRAYLRRLLEPHWSVEVVDDGEEALEAARARPPDLVLSDVMMPRLDGFSLLRALRAQDQTRSIPVVLLSARAGDDATVGALDAGADDYLTKPFSARELLARVRSQLELARLRKAADDERERMYTLFAQAPMPICVVRGADLVFELANDEYLKVCGRSDILGRPLLEALPEVRGQGLDELLRKVMESNEAIVGKERLLRLDRGRNGRLEDTYWTFIYAPLRMGHSGVDRVMLFCNDVTDEVLARKAIESSEAKFRQIVSQVQAGIAQTDLDGRFNLTNERYREIVGRSRAELRELSMHDIVHPEELPRHQSLFERLVETGSPYVHEERYLRPDGSIVWVQSSVSRIDGPLGQPLGAAAVTIDVTRRKFAELALQASEARFRSIFETAEVSIWQEDFSAVKSRVDALRAQHGDLRALFEAQPSLVDEIMGLVRIRDVNPATLRMFGASSKEELLAAFGSIFVPESRPVLVEELVAIAEGQASFSSEVTLRTLSGERLDVLLTIGFQHWDRPCERVLVTLVDISARRVAEREREARAEEMERAVRFSEMFAGILGHDLRNPLNAIMMSGSLLARRADEVEGIAEPVGRILRSGDRMDRMISQLLDFTRVRLGRGIPLQRTEVDLAEVARVMSDEVEPVCGRAAQVEVTGDATGRWDRDRLLQLVSNLMANACQHSPEGSPVAIRVDGSSHDTVRLEVHNDGVIAEELLPDIFEPLRGGAAKRSGSSGLGLGLYITQQIALAHGGDIRVDSRPSHGTSFHVDLPRRSEAETSNHVFSADPSSRP